MVRYSETPVLIEHHGFDPCPMSKAIELSQEFKALSPHIDTTQNAFFLTDDLLDSLLTEPRNNTPFDGIRATFGIDIHKRVVLIFTKEYGKMIDNREVYYYNPQYYFNYYKTHNRFNLIEGGILTVNKDGICNGQIIDLKSEDYHKMLSNYRAFFCNDSLLTSLTVDVSMAAFALKETAPCPNRPALLTPPPLAVSYHVVYSYFIGKTVLRHIRGANRKMGIKVFLGYGPSTPHTPFKNIHLLVVATTDKDEQLNSKSKKKVWGTFDGTQQFALYMAPAGGGTTSQLPEGVMPMDGSSTCVRPSPPYSPEQ